MNIYNIIDSCLFKYVDSLCFPGRKCGIIIPHIVNNINKMGSGFVVPLYTRWPIVKSEYHKKCDFYLKDLGFFPSYMLGMIQPINVTNTILVINMFAQDGIRSKRNPNPIKYDALANCLKKIKTTYSCINNQIVAPRFGSGLAGGDWNIIKEMINKYWVDFDVTICCKE